MSALKDPQGFGSYEAACWFRESADADVQPRTLMPAEQSPPPVPARPEPRGRDEPEESQPNHS
jgi:hypothetical protein